MKVLFVDVGQGTCQIILTGNRKAVVIDSGSSPKTVLRALRLLRIETIELLCISHSHNDHAGGAASKKRKTRSRPSTTAGLLVDFEGAIERIAYVFDSQMRNTAFGQYLVRMLKAGTIRKEQLLSIEATTKPKPIWESSDGKSHLTVMSPLAGTKLLSWDGDNPNAASAVLELRHRGQRIIFSGDSEYDQWRDILRLRGNRTLDCLAISMPHHGGLMQGTDADLDWFRKQAVNPEVVVVSVGTLNSHKHPRPEVIGAMSQSATVICTQITRQCCNKLEGLRPGVIGPAAYPCQSSSTLDIVKRKKKRNGKKVRQQRSRNVACGGTIVARLDDAGIHLERIADHQAGVDRLVDNGFLPLCRE